MARQQITDMFEDLAKKKSKKKEARIKKTTKDEN